MKATTAGLVPKCLQAESMECIFGVLRTSLVPLYTATDEHDAITPILTKNVEEAAFMADGYAGANGKI